MGIEAFAETALKFLPGWHVEAIEDVNFLAPFKFYRGEARAVRVEVKIHPQAESLVADCRLIGQRALPTQTEPQLTIHFTARVRLAKQPAQAPTSKAFVEPHGNAVEAADIYQLYFHGPAYQVVEKAWRNGTQVVGLLAKDLPPNHHPAEVPAVMAPRLIELCFQTAGIWEMGLQSRMGLPQHVDRVSLFRSPGLAESRLYAVVTPNEEQSSFAAEVLDQKGNCYLRLSGYKTVALPQSIEAARLEPLHAVMSEQTALVA